MSWSARDVIKDLDAISLKANELTKKWLMEHTYPPLVRLRIFFVKKKELDVVNSPGLTLVGAIEKLRTMAKEIEKIKSEELMTDAIEIFHNNLIHLTDFMKKFERACDLVNELYDKQQILEKAPESIIAPDHKKFLVRYILNLITKISERASLGDDYSEYEEKAIEAINLVNSLIDRLGLLPFKDILGPLSVSTKPSVSSRPVSLPAPKVLEPIDSAAFSEKVQNILQEVDAILEGQPHFETLEKRVSEALAANKTEVDISDIPIEYARMFIDFYKDADLRLNLQEKKLLVQPKKN